MKEKMRLLAKLTKPGARVLDVSGIPVAPRSRMEIATWPKVLSIRAQMQPFEQQTFGKLRKEYRQLKKETEFLVNHFLGDYLDGLTQGLATGEFRLQESKEVEND